MDISFGFYLFSLFLNLGALDLHEDQCQFIEVDKTSLLLLNERLVPNHHESAGAFIKPFKMSNSYRFILCGSGKLTLGTLRHEIGHAIDFVSNKGSMSNNYEIVADTYSYYLGNDCDDLYHGIVSDIAGDAYTDNYHIDHAHLSLSSRMVICDEFYINPDLKGFGSVIEAELAAHTGNLRAVKYSEWSGLFIVLVIIGVVLRKLFLFVKSLF